MSDPINKFLDESRHLSGCKYREYRDGSKRACTCGLHAAQVYARLKPQDPLTYHELDAIIAADGRGWLESDGVIAIFVALKARGLCKGEHPPVPEVYKR